MIILGIFVITVLSFMLMAMLDMLVFQQPYLKVFVHLLPVYPDTSTIFMFLVAFAMAAWVQYGMTERLKKRYGGKNSNNQSGEKRDAKQS
ncbi:hypothetical protein [Paenibacillus glycanilyticus]|uniref:DUF2627 domain-containing protein n=1 Tax=Paenibacillus glycanilyticus TaxID=126569 RepID=A0ABQ6GBB5_9BACL|nr:hypothetical protein [Paenibacillus glycanilyticus]GLX67932.1 hypothetical protein MU1_22770 [Paenibacillus glycanilyticus]